MDPLARRKEYIINQEIGKILRIVGERESCSLMEAFVSYRRCYIKLYKIIPSWLDEALRRECSGNVANRSLRPSGK
jgi:hypothetical protein